MRSTRRLQSVAARACRRVLAGGYHRRGQGVGPARPRRRRLPDRAEVELHAARCGGPEIPGLQLRRERAGHLSRSRHPALQPALTGRGHGDRRLRDGRNCRLQLHPRRVPRRAGAALRGGRQRGVRRRPARQEHRRRRDRHRYRDVRRRRRLYLRRGNGVAGVARRETGAAALQAAVPGQLRAVRQAHDDQQHAEPGKRAGHHSQRRGLVCRPRSGGLGRHGNFFGVRACRAAGEL